MEIGNKILELRKKGNLSQEQLAEKINVTRQTISKWELNETTPDIKQAKELSKIFKVSLDELTGNDVNKILVQKISNTEKLAGIIVKILKFIGIAFIILLIIDIVALILFASTGKLKNLGSSSTMYCETEDSEYEISFDSDKNFICENCSKEMNKEIKALIDFDDASNSINNIEEYFDSNNGTCE